VALFANKFNLRPIARQITTPHTHEDSQVIAPPRAKRKLIRYLDNGKGKTNGGESESKAKSERESTATVDTNTETDKVTTIDSDTRLQMLMLNGMQETREIGRKMHISQGAQKTPHEHTVTDPDDKVAGKKLPTHNAVACTMLTDTIDETDGLCPPQLILTNEPVTGQEKVTLRRENKTRRLMSQVQQVHTTYWVEARGQFYLPDDLPTPVPHRNRMCPSGLARNHPAGDLLESWAKFGCPTMTGKPWTKQEMEEAVQRGPHVSATTPEAFEHFAQEITEKIMLGQAKLMLWDDIKDNPPPQLKISPIAAIPHKSKAYRSILDLSFSLALQDGTHLPSVNDATTKTAPRASIDQLGHSLSRLIHAFAEAKEDDKIFMAKWDVKDGFWRLDCQDGEEYNFAYVLPQPPGKPTTLVIPTSLQMGWIESPGFFCAASETSRDVAEQYCQTKLGSLPDHKFTRYMVDSDAWTALPPEAVNDDNLKFLIEVFVDDFMSLIIATSQRQCTHVGTATMMGIHDVFPPDDTPGEDPISEKKMEKNETRFDTQKTLLGFDFDGDAKTIWLSEEKRAALLLILKGWLRTSERTKASIPFKQFESVVAKLRHAFTAIPAGKGLLSPCNKLLALKPHSVFLHRNNDLRIALRDIRTLLQNSVTHPTRCRELVSGHPHLIGYCDASKYGFGGIVIGESTASPPTVFRGQWTPDIKQDLVSNDNPQGRISISDLEMAGLLLMWFVVEAVHDGKLPDLKVALFSDNAPTISWVDRLASRRSLVGARLVRALALRLKLTKACPLTPLHVAGKQNTMADMASRSFGSVPKWYCASDAEFSLLFNKLFQLPSQNTWTVFRLSTNIVMRVISVLRMTDSSLAEWQRIPKIGQNIGTIGAPMSNLWEWIRTLNRPPTQNAPDCSPDLQQETEKELTDAKNKSKLQQSLQRSRPLARRSLWNVRETLQK
jgi:hypothetical protein